MGTELSTFLADSGSKLPALNADEMAKGLDYGAEGTTGGGDFKFLNFSGKSGVYSLGQDKEEVDEDALFIVEPSGNRRGWVCWKGSKPIARVGWSVYQPSQEVAEDMLEDKGPYKDGEGWSPERIFLAYGLDGKQIAFSTTSKSGNNAVADLWGKIKDELVAGDPHLPVIRFDSTEFVAQDKKNFKPVFEIVAWVTIEAATAYSMKEMSKEDLLAGKPAKKKAAKKKAASKKKAAKKKR